jgi:hypothetical protein
MRSRFEVGDEVKDTAENRSGVIIQIFCQRALVRWNYYTGYGNTYGFTWENFGDLLHMDENFDDINS